MSKVKGLTMRKNEGFNRWEAHFTFSNGIQYTICGIPNAIGRAAKAELESYANERIVEYAREHGWSVEVSK